MPRTGVANLPLHYGNAPRWLFRRMTKLAGGITRTIVYEYGKDEFLRRISDPFWFQAFSCVLGFDWHSSGTTTVTCGALKEALLQENVGILAAGGKGQTSRATPAEIEKLAEEVNLSTSSLEKLKYSSRMCARVDSVAIQAGYQLYHHVIIFTEDGSKWAVVQQGLDEQTRYARRYHWLSENVRNFVEEPHEGIVGFRREGDVLDMTSGESCECRKVSVDLAREGSPNELDKLRKRLKFDPKQRSLLEFIPGEELKFLHMPATVNWDAMKILYDFQPRNYEELIALRGVGPKTVRALALISELVYGKPPSWKDPVKYSFTVGGKDGVPYPVNRKVMDESIEILKAGIEEAELGREEKIKALRRLKEFVP